MTSVQLWVFVHGGNLLTSLAEADQQLSANVGVGHLAAAEPNRHLDAIAVLQELLGVLELDVEIVGVDAGGHADFLDLGDMLVLLGLFFLFGLFKAELSVVHDPAHRRGGVGRDLHQIQPLLISPRQCVPGGHDAQLIAGGSDDPYLFVTNVLIELMVLLADMKHLQQKTRMQQQHPQIANRFSRQNTLSDRFATLAVRAGLPLLLP